MVSGIEVGEGEGGESEDKGASQQPHVRHNSNLTVLPETSDLQHLGSQIGWD